MPEISFDELLTLSDRYKSKVIEILRDLVRFPTVAFREPSGIAECASYLVDLFQSYGFKAYQYPTTPTGSPVVYAEKNVGASKTLMYYNHYDVQPEDPLELWESSPWKLSERGERLYGRGTIDNKGPFTINLIATQVLEDQLGQLPINIKFVIEGEEEAGSDNLHHFTKPHVNLLKADGCIWEGAGLFETQGDSVDVEKPVEIWCGLKGNAYYELKAGKPPNFPNRDVHSGYAPSVPNAAWSLVWALSTLKDEHENILIEGFNDLVVEPSKEDIQALKEYKGDLESLLKQDYQLENLLLDRSQLSLYIPLFLGPSLSICGLTSGYQDPGSKTIVPARAQAKIDFRLVPNLTVEKVTQLLKNHLMTHGFKDIELEFITGYEPAKTSVTDPFIQTIRNTTKKLADPVPVNLIPFAPGSGPAYLFTDYTPLCVVIGPIDGVNGHAPNENMPKNIITSDLAYNAFLAQSLSK